jgi:hypothetical protein
MGTLSEHIRRKCQVAKIDAEAPLNWRTVYFNGFELTYDDYVPFLDLIVWKIVSFVVAKTWHNKNHLMQVCRGEKFILFFPDSVLKNATHCERDCFAALRVNFFTD